MARKTLGGDSSGGWWPLEPRDLPPSGGSPLYPNPPEEALGDVVPATLHRMRLLPARLLIAFLPAVASIVPQSAVAAEVRWIAYVRADQPFQPGTLHLVQSTGGGARTLARKVLTADMGGDGQVFAVHQEGADLTRSSVIRLSSAGSSQELLPPNGTLYVSLASGPQGQVAVLRFVNRGSEAPAFLRDAIPVLASTEVSVLTPPKEPRGPMELETVAEGARRSYRLMFTNDPGRELSHAEQYNLFVEGRRGSQETPPDATEVEVRGTTGAFFCGASTCFLYWEEGGTTYLVGEFGSPDDAAAFAESLVAIEEVAGAEWRRGGQISAPELITLESDGTETVLESVEGFCECGFQPVSWNPTGDHLLVIQGGEGFTELVEYPATGEEPETLEQGDLEGMIFDAAYGPDGVLLLRAGEGGLVGSVETLDGEVVVRDARAFDVSGSTMAYVRETGQVVVRNMTNGRERTVGRGAVDVSVSTDALPARGAEEPPLEPASGSRSPLLWTALALGALAVLGGGVLLGTRLRRG